jgi:hypothetical protein
LPRKPPKAKHHLPGSVAVDAPLRIDRDRRVGFFVMSRGVLR